SCARTNRRAESRWFGRRESALPCAAHPRRRPPENPSQLARRHPHFYVAGPYRTHRPFIPTDLRSAPVCLHPNIDCTRLGVRLLLFQVIMPLFASHREPLHARLKILPFLADFI